MRFVGRIALITFLFSLSLFAVQAQDAPIAQDPCWVLSNPPDTPTDDSEQALLEHSALQMADTGDYDTALTLIERLINDSPDYAPAYALRGCMHERDGDINEALDDWQMFLGLNQDAALSPEVEHLISIYDDNLECVTGGVFETQREGRQIVTTYNAETAVGDDHNQRGLAYLCLGYYDLAIRDFARALDTDKNSSIYYNNRGYTYSVLGETDKAIKDYTKALDLNPQSTIALSNRGDLYRQQGDYDNALRDLNDALFIDPAYESALSNRATLYREMEEYEKAIDDYTALIAITPSTIYYNWRGIMHLNLEQYAEARESFLSAVELAPDSSLYWYNLGNASYYLGQTDVALDAFTEALTLDPTDADALDWRAYIYSETSQHAQCIADYTVLFTMDSPQKDDAYNWVDRGSCYYSINKEDQAIRDFNQAIEIDPENATAYAYRGVAYRDLARYTTALDDLSTAIDLNDEYAYAWRQRATVYQSMKEYDKALDDFAEAIKLAPNNADTYDARGEMYAEMERYEEAQADYDLAVELAPNFPYYLNRRGLFYEKTRDYNAAIENYDAALELDPTFALAYMNRGYAYYELKEYSAAKRDFETYLDIDPETIYREGVQEKLDVIAAADS